MYHAVEIRSKLKIVPWPSLEISYPLLSRVENVSQIHAGRKTRGNQVEIRHLIPGLKTGTWSDFPVQELFAADLSGWSCSNNREILIP